jgi:3-oxoacid CoA-transferase B subunit
VSSVVLGGFQVAPNGDLANWNIPSTGVGGIGGAMDLAACAKHVFVAMEQVTRNGRPRLVERCAIPVTAKGVVDLVITNYGLFAITPEGMALREIAPGVSIDEVKATVGCNLLIPREVPPVRLRT